MNQSFTRWMAVLLIPCLIGDPIPASAFALRPTPNLNLCYTDQAMVAPFAGALFLTMIDPHGYVHAYQTLLVVLGMGVTSAKVSMAMVLVVPKKGDIQTAIEKNSFKQAHELEKAWHQFATDLDTMLIDNPDLQELAEAAVGGARRLALLRAGIAFPESREIKRIFIGMTLEQAFPRFGYFNMLYWELYAQALIQNQNDRKALTQTKLVALMDALVKPHGNLRAIAGHHGVSHRTIKTHPILGPRLAKLEIAEKKAALKQASPITEAVPDLETVVKMEENTSDQPDSVNRKLIDYRAKPKATFAAVPYSPEDGPIYRRLKSHLRLPNWFGKPPQMPTRVRRDQSRQEDSVNLNRPLHVYRDEGHEKIWKRERAEAMRATRAPYKEDMGLEIDNSASQNSAVTKAMNKVMPTLRAGVLQVAHTILALYHDQHTDREEAMDAMRPLLAKDDFSTLGHALDDLDATHVVVQKDPPITFLTAPAIDPSYIAAVRQKLIIARDEADQASRKFQDASFQERNGNLAGAKEAIDLALALATSSSTHWVELFVKLESGGHHDAAQWISSRYEEEERILLVIQTLQKKLDAKVSQNKPEKAPKTQQPLTPPLTPEMMKKVETYRGYLEDIKLKPNRRRIYTKTEIDRHYVESLSPELKARAKDAHLRLQAIPSDVRKANQDYIEWLQRSQKGFSAESIVGTALGILFAIALSLTHQDGIQHLLTVSTGLLIDGIMMGAMLWGMDRHFGHLYRQPIRKIFEAA